MYLPKVIDVPGRPLGPVCVRQKPDHPVRDEGAAHPQRHCPERRPHPREHVQHFKLSVLHQYRHLQTRRIHIP